MDDSCGLKETSGTFWSHEINHQDLCSAKAIFRSSLEILPEKYLTLLLL